VTVASRAPSELARRLERYRSALAPVAGPTLDAGDPELPHRRLAASELADRLAEVLDGEVVAGPRGRYVRVEGRPTDLPVDRGRLARLPGQPPADRPLVCLDTETTGLATAAGTVAFLIGVGWWDGPTFRQVQLVLPDHGEEPALLDALAALIPSDAWLVTYNGRGFDWPLLVTRYRLARRSAPIHDGHLDLLPVVRRVFRHRMDDARLQTAERTLLGLVRHDDVDGWEIPGRFLGFLRGGPAQPLAAVVRHNDEDVRSLARLVALLDAGYTTAEGRRAAPLGDVAGLARAFVRARRHDEALECLDEVLDRPGGEPDLPVPLPRPGQVPPLGSAAALPWWAPDARADFGGPPRRPDPGPSRWHRTAAFGSPWDRQRVEVDRAHLLRRLGRFDDAAAAWAAIAAGPGRCALIGWIELAKLREHRLGDPLGALRATDDGLTAVERRRRLGLPEPALEADLVRRRRRLARRLNRSATSGRRRASSDRASRPAGPRSAGSPGGPAPAPDGP
jgi:hypothetical protein